MPHEWDYLIQADRQYTDLNRLGEKPNGQIYLAWVMKSLRRELSLRFEKRSFVHDDGSQMLYDRWENQEVWGDVPTPMYPFYKIEKIGEVSARNVSIVRQSQAFSLAIPAMIKESSIGTLLLMKKFIEYSIQEGVKSPEKILDRIQNNEIMRFVGENVDNVFFPFETSKGFSLIYASKGKFEGCLHVRNELKDWNVSIADETSGIINDRNDKEGNLLTALIYPQDKHKRFFQIERDRNNALFQLKEWINGKIERLEYERMSRMGKYDVALSFAGEDREIVEDVATRLILRGYQVFYDKYEQADLWGKDLYQHLASVYSEQASFCVVFVSKNYHDKLWTKHELRQAQARAFKESREYILPVRLDDTQLPGLPETIGYLNLEEVGINELVNLLSDKIEELL